VASVLVTGGAGFIGSHLVDALVSKGHDVLAVDNLTPQVHPVKPDYFNPEARYVFADIREDSVLEAALEDREVVYHLASAVGVGQSMYRIHEYVDVNTAATAKLVNNLRMLMPPLPIGI
jgi:dTDP-L-rhamnose 4-epimerase